MAVKSQHLNIWNVRKEQTQTEQSDWLSIYEACTITRTNVGINLWTFNKENTENSEGSSGNNEAHHLL